MIKLDEFNQGLYRTDQKDGLLAKPCQNCKPFGGQSAAEENYLLQFKKNNQFST